MIYYIFFYIVSSKFTEHPEYSLNKVVGEEIKLTCSVITDTNTQLIWYFYNNSTVSQVTSSEKIGISYTTVGQHIISNLTLHDIDLSFSGTYACFDRDTYSNTSFVYIECENIIVKSLYNFILH